jgi:acyl-CoA synthetase (NDP forming)
MRDAASGAGAYARLARLFEPRTIAVIGASDQPGNLGGRAVALLAKFAFPGDVWPVNPRRTIVGGLRCYPSLRELPAPADLAILAVPANAIVDAVRDCAAAGIGHGIAWAGGFAESGAEGLARQRALVDVCRATRFLLCGPNSLGIVNAWLPLAATFASSLVTTEQMLRGRISIVSQSGGLAMATQALAQQAGFGIRHLISSGNEAVLGMADYLDALTDDAETAVIAAYVEGISDGAAFTAALTRARQAGKPIVMLKAGRTRATARAAAAHTGALAGDDRVWRAIMREHAVISVETTRELLDTAVYLASIDRATLPAGRRVCVVSFGGGGGVLAADLCTRHGLETPSLAPATCEALSQRVPAIASIANPVDLTPAAFGPQWLAQFPAALDGIAADPNVDALLFPLSAMAQGAAPVAEAIAQFRRRTSKTVCIAWVLAPSEGLDVLAQDGLYAFPDSARAIDTLAKTAMHAAALRTPTGSVLPPFAFAWEAHLRNANPGTVVPEDACHAILRAAGLRTAEGRLASTADAAVAAARAVGFPVALKGISPAVTHRAAAGLLALDRRDDNEVRAAFGQLAAHAAASGIALTGIYVQHMAPGKIELLVSAFRDSEFGVMVTCGAGGNLAELIDDVTLERAPFDTERARQVLQRLRIAGHATRLDPAAELDAPADFVARFSQLAATAPWRRFVLEVNPIRWQGENVVAVDGLLIVEEP